MKHEPRKPSDNTCVSLVTCVGLVPTGTFLSDAPLRTLLTQGDANTLNLRVASVLAGVDTGNVPLAVAIPRTLPRTLTSFSRMFDKTFLLDECRAISACASAVQQRALGPPSRSVWSHEQVLIPTPEPITGRVGRFKRMRERTVAYTIANIHDNSALGRQPQAPGGHHKTQRTNPFLRRRMFRDAAAGTCA